MEKEGFEITYLNVDKNGKINIEDLEKYIRSDTILISVMFANNEIGTIEPIAEIGKMAKAHNVLFHTDSVQAIRKCENKCARNEYRFAFNVCTQILWTKGSRSTLCKKWY